MIRRWLRTDREEILDREGPSGRGARILTDLHRFNRLSGWYAGHVRHVGAWWEALGRPRPFRVLDVGTGAGGLLEKVVESGLPVEAIGVDLHPAYVALAEARLGGRARIVQADATDLPWEDGRFDLVTNTLMMHHLPAGVRRRMVAEMGRVARGVYLFDVELTLYGMAGWAAVAPLIGAHPDSWHDGVVSVRRACTFPEFRDLVAPLPVRPRRFFPSAMGTLPR